MGNLTQRVFGGARVTASYASAVLGYAAAEYVIGDSIEGPLGEVIKFAINLLAAGLLGAFVHQAVFGLPKLEVRWEYEDRLLTSEELIINEPKSSSFHTWSLSIARTEYGWLSRQLFRLLDRDGAHVVIRLSPQGHVAVGKDSDPLSEGLPPVLFDGHMVRIPLQGVSAYNPVRTFGAVFSIRRRATTSAVKVAITYELDCGGGALMRTICAFILLGSRVEGLLIQRAI